MVFEEEKKEPETEVVEEAPAEEAPLEEVKEEVPIEEAPAEEVKEEVKEEKPKKTSKKKDSPAKPKTSSESDDSKKKEEAPAEETPKEVSPEEEPSPEPKVAKKKPKKESGFERPPLFGKYDMEDINITDKGLERYINLNLITIPHVSARYANKMFGKAKVSIIERLINGMMRTERFTGKKSKTYKVVEYSFDIIHQRTKQNPIQIFVESLQNTAPREEVTRLRFGGISVPKAVDISPQRRLDLALRNICKGAIKSSHKNKKSIQECLANEIIAAANADMNSFAISKKEEVERVAKSAR